MTDRKLTILVLADSRSFHTERYVRELRRQGCHVILASLERGNIHHYTLKARGFFRQLHYIMAATEVRSLIRRRSYLICGARTFSWSPTSQDFTAVKPCSASKAPTA